MAWIFLFLGFVLLVKGADWMVEGASALASRFQVSLLVIGMTVVAFGTSAPELMVNLIASASGEGNLALGNVVGSNISNLLFVLGCMAALTPLSFSKNLIRLDIPLSLLACFLLAVLGYYAGEGVAFILRRGGAVILILIFACYMIYLFKFRTYQALEEDFDKAIEIPKAVLLTLVGLVGLVLGGEWVVDSASTIAGNLAQRLGWSGVDRVLGLTVVALGTSLPELAASIVAIRKSKIALAVGNIIGSNIFNLLWVLGASALVMPLEADIRFLKDLLWCFVATLVTLFFIVFPSHGNLNRLQGGILIVAYFVYLSSLIGNMT